MTSHPPVFQAAKQGCPPGHQPPVSPESGSGRVTTAAGWRLHTHSPPPALSAPTGKWLAQNPPAKQLRSDESLGEETSPFTKGRGKHAKRPLAAFYEVGLHGSHRWWQSALIKRVCRLLGCRELVGAGAPDRPTGSPLLPRLHGLGFTVDPLAALALGMPASWAWITSPHPSTHPPPGRMLAKRPLGKGPMTQLQAGNKAANQRNSYLGWGVGGRERAQKQSKKGKCAHILPHSVSRTL